MKSEALLKKPYPALMGILAVVIVVVFMLPQQKRALPVGTQAKQQKVIKTSVYKTLEKRFAGTLDFKPDPLTTMARQGWQGGTVGDGPAFLDEKTGMVYSGRTGLLLRDWSEESWMRALKHCSEKQPAGFWSLPTETEMEVGKRHGLVELSNDMRHRWLASYIRGDGHFNGPALRIWGGPAEYVYVLCVGRTENAPDYGFIRDDVDNRYNIIPR